MKTKYFSRILGWGLSSAMAVSLGIGVIAPPPVAGQGLMEWGEITTPSWEDEVIEPGSDIYDYAIGSEDGDIVYAVGAINSVGVQRSPVDIGVEGLRGSFSFHSGEVTLTWVSASVCEFSGELIGDGIYLRGDFTAIMDSVTIAPPGISGVAVVTGFIDGAPEPGDNDDEMTFSGFLYGSFGASFGTVTADLIDDEVICISDWVMQPWSSGAVSYSPGMYGGSLFTEPRAWSSSDGGVTWTDITETVQDATNLPGPFIQFAYGGVASAPDDEDWLVVAGTICDPKYFVTPPPAAPYSPFGFPPGVPALVASKDGAGEFSFAGDMVDTVTASMMKQIYDVDVSIEQDDIHNIAVAGIASPIAAGFPVPPPYGSVFRLEAGTWLTGTWEDTTAYAGWDDSTDVLPAVLASNGVVEGAFSTNFDIDVTYLCMTVDVSGPNPLPYLQSGIWETGGTWNGEAGFADAVQIMDDGEELWTLPGLRSMGIAVPADYDGSDPGARNLYVYVNAYNSVSGTVGGTLVMVEDSSISWRCGPSGDPLLASIAVWGDADSAKAMVGTMIGWDQEPSLDVGDPIPFDCCTGVAVYHTVELDYCCPDWDAACKDPSGPYAAVVAYTPDGDKAFATTSGALDIEWIGFGSGWGTGETDLSEYWGGLCDESAFSVSLDDGVSFNQLGLIDTDIDILSDVAVCPDCGVIYLSTINWMEHYDFYCDGYWEEVEVAIPDTDPVEYEWVWEFTGYEPLKEAWQVCACDSVWRSYDSGDTWERVNHGDWSESWEDQLLLRLPVDDLEDCCTVYLGLQNTTDLLYSRDCGQCWNTAPTQKIVIQDVAVETENIVYILDAEGYVSKSTQYGRRPADEVDTELGSGHTIAVMPDDMVIVGGDDGDSVGWSDDGGDTWTIMDDILGDGDIHVIFDHLCDDTVYAALSEDTIYRGFMSTGEWEDLEAFAYGYFGIVLGRSDGTLYAATDNINVDSTESLCDRFVAPGATAADEWYSGVARNLTPCETDCCGAEDWDYLISGLGEGPEEWFDNEPSALRICGCTTIGTNTILWAIDWDYYYVADGSDGTLWAYEDCASKVGPTLLAPADETVIDCDPCACKPVPFTLKWERMCLGCSYDIELYDVDGNFINGWYNVFVDPADPAEFYIYGDDLEDYLGECGVTYTWAVRLSDTETDECVHSPWSDTWSFTVAAGATTPLHILAPENGEMGVQISNVGFSWTSIPNATSYSFVLSPNSDLSGALASAEVTGTAFQYTGTLSYMTPYYCQVTAWVDGTELLTSNVGVFTTAAEAVPPPEPPPTPPAPVIEIPPTQMITPSWIYAIIGIGCALAVVVIVLIVRTRQRP